MHFGLTYWEKQAKRAQKKSKDQFINLFAWYIFLESISQIEKVEKIFI